MFTCLLPIPSAKAIPIFSDGFESGNCNAWTNMYGSPIIVEEPTHTGSHSMKAPNDKDVGAWYVLSTPLSVVSAEIYIYYSSQPSPGQVQVPLYFPYNFKRDLAKVHYYNNNVSAVVRICRWCRHFFLQL
jgi:hypothetical protein